MLVTGAILPGRPGTHALRVVGGRIAALTADAGPARCVVLPTLCDAHVHLDKGFTVERAGQSETGLLGAIALVEADKRLWTAEDLYARASLGLQSAYQSGTSAMRSHVDWPGPAIPTAWTVFDALAADWTGRIELQRAALIALDQVFELGRTAAAAVASSGGVLGFFVLMNDALETKLERAFEIAVAHDLDLDFHVDETLAPRATGLGQIARLTERHGWHGRVVCGHACSLTTQPARLQQEILGLCASAGIHLITLPSSNHYLQDRRPGRTPRKRGLMPVHEARAAGIGVSIASDNCADPFYPYGQFDLMESYRLALVTAHLDPEAWVDAITSTPRRAMKLLARDLAPGAPADFILFEAPSLRAAFGNPATPRLVIRAGLPVERDAAMTLGPPDASSVGRPWTRRAAGD